MAVAKKDVGIELYQFRGSFSKIARCPIFDLQATTFAPFPLLQLLNKNGDPFPHVRIVHGDRHQHTHAALFDGLVERALPMAGFPRRRANKESFAASFDQLVGAGEKLPGEGSSCNALAAFRLMTSSIVLDAPLADHGAWHRAESGRHSERETGTARAHWAHVMSNPLLAKGAHPETVGNLASSAKRAICPLISNMLESGKTTKKIAAGVLAECQKSGWERGCRRGR